MQDRQAVWAPQELRGLLEAQESQDYQDLWVQQDQQER